MKRIICLYLSILFICISFAGCSGKAEEKSVLLADQYSVEDSKNIKYDVELPYKFVNKGITILEVKQYSGKYIEGGNDEENCTGVAILVRNDSGKYAEYIRIAVNASNGSEAVFDAGYIGPGMSVWIQDESRIEKCSLIFSSADIIVSANDKEWDIKRLNILVSFDENKPNNIIAENIGGFELADTEIFYRRKQDMILVGGIVYSTQLGNIKRGEKLNILANHFDKYFTLCKVTTNSKEDEL